MSRRSGVSGQSRSVIRTVLHPATLFVVPIIVALAAIASIDPARIYSHTTAKVSLLNGAGLAWVGACTLAFVIGTKIGTTAGSRTVERKGGWERRYGREATLALFAALALATFVWGWTLGVAQAVGGYVEFLKEISTSWQKIRRVWPDSAPFKGARIVYTAVVGLIAVGGARIAFADYECRRGGNIKSLGTGKWWITLVASLPFLVALPFFASQRVIVALGLLAGVVGYAVCDPRWAKLWYFAGSAVLFIGLWITFEYVRVGMTPEEALSHIHWYISVGLAQELLSINYIDNHTMGAYLFEPARWIVYAGPPPGLNTSFGSTAVRGPYGPFTRLYFDFNVLGALVFVGLGCVAGYVFKRSEGNTLFAPVYGLIGGSLVLQLHNPLYLHPVVWFNIAVVWALHEGGRLSVRR